MRKVLLAVVVAFAAILPAAPVAAYDLWDCKNQFNKPGIKMYNGSNFDGTNWTLCATDGAVGEDPKLGAGESNEPYSRGVTGMANKIESIRLVAPPGSCIRVAVYDNTWYSDRIAYFGFVTANDGTWSSHNIYLNPEDKNRADSIRVSFCV